MIYNLLIATTLILFSFAAGIHYTTQPTHQLVEEPHTIIIFQDGEKLFDTRS